MKVVVFLILTSTASGGAISNALAIDANLYLSTARTLIFEGATSDTNRTTLTVTDPTAARTITFADETGTVITTGSTDAITESMMANDSISSSRNENFINFTNIKLIWNRIKNYTWRWCLKMELDYGSKKTTIQ